MAADKSPGARQKGQVTFHNEEPPPTRALVVHADVRPQHGKAGGEKRSARTGLEEITGLARAIDLDIAHAFTIRLGRVVPAAYLGTGKIEELRKKVADSKVELVVIDAPLTPGQQRNLEKALDCKVLDRTGLILEIFGRRAQTREGRLQVELAHLSYQKTRLVRSWTHLERQRGGAGFMGGPGETQLESDRRVLQDRISRLERQLEKVKKTRRLQRASRQKVPYPVVALAGYTNAGKSTLFNRLTGSGVMAKDILFATLDPTMRKLVLPHGRTVILSDTVGFIGELPTQLVAAFRATLEEVLAADLIVHVRDISHVDSELQRDDVLAVLSELGVDTDKPGAMLEVWNKCDLLGEDERQRRMNEAARREDVVAISALSGEGIDSLLEEIESRLARNDNILHLVVGHAHGADMAWIHENGDVLERTDLENENASEITARFSPTRIGAARQRLGEYIIG